MSTINNREIKIVEYSTEQNWFKQIPSKDWLCVIVENNRPRRYLDEVISKILTKNVCYICAVGQTSEKTHDLVDEEIGFREVDIDNLYLPKHDILTTWDNDLADGIWFAIFTAHNEEVIIKEIIILDMTDGLETKNIEQIVSKLLK